MSKSSLEVTPGPSMPKRLDNHCFTKLTNGMDGIVIGQAKEDNYKNNRYTMHYHSPTKHWSLLAVTGSPEQADYFSCALMAVRKTSSSHAQHEWIVVAGQALMLEILLFQERALTIRETFIFDVSKLEWIAGPDLPVRVCCGEMVSSSDKQSAFLVGGKYNVRSEDVLKLILKLKCDGNQPDTCHWGVINAELKYSWESFLVLPVQSQWVTCSGSKYQEGACLHNQILQVGDGFCDDDSNVVGCLYDGGDCCRPIISAQFCTKCLCHKTNKVNHKEEPRTEIGPTKACTLGDFADYPIAVP